MVERVLCHHNEPAKVCTIRKGDMQGSTFYACPRASRRDDPNGCGFFEWCEQHRPDDGDDSGGDWSQDFPIFHEDI